MRVSFSIFVTAWVRSNQQELFYACELLASMFQGICRAEVKLNVGRLAFDSVDLMFNILQQYCRLVEIRSDFRMEWRFVSMTII